MPVTSRRSATGGAGRISGRCLVGEITIVGAGGAPSSSPGASDFEGTGLVRTRVARFPLIVTCSVTSGRLYLAYARHADGPHIKLNDLRIEQLAHGPTDFEVGKVQRPPDRTQVAAAVHRRQDPPLLTVEGYLPGVELGDQTWLHLERGDKGLELLPFGQAPASLLEGFPNRDIGAADRGARPPRVELEVAPVGPQQLEAGLLDALGRIARYPGSLVLGLVGTDDDAVDEEQVGGVRTAPEVQAPAHAAVGQKFHHGAEIEDVESTVQRHRAHSASLGPLEWPLRRPAGRSGLHHGGDDAPAVEEGHSREGQEVVAGAEDATGRGVAWGRAAPSVLRASGRVWVGEQGGDRGRAGVG